MVVPFKARTDPRSTVLSKALESWPATLDLIRSLGTFIVHTYPHYGAWFPPQTHDIWCWCDHMNDASKKLLVWRCLKYIPGKQKRESDFPAWAACAWIAAFVGEAPCMCFVRMHLQYTTEPNIKGWIFRVVLLVYQWFLTHLDSRDWCGIHWFIVPSSGTCWTTFGNGKFLEFPAENIWKSSCFGGWGVPSLLTHPNHIHLQIQVALLPLALRRLTIKRWDCRASLALGMQHI